MAFGPSYSARQACLGCSLLEQVAFLKTATRTCELQSRIRCFHPIFRSVDTVFPPCFPRVLAFSSAMPFLHSALLSVAENDYKLCIVLSFIVIVYVSSFFKQTCTFPGSNTE